MTRLAARLRILSLLYALTFAATFVPALLFPADRALLFSSVIFWGPRAIAITMALLVAVVIRSDRLPLSAVMPIGLAFEVAGSHAITAAEFLNPTALDNLRWPGLSWVKNWPGFAWVRPAGWLVFGAVLVWARAGAVIRAVERRQAAMWVLGMVSSLRSSRICGSQ